MASWVKEFEGRKLQFSSRQLPISSGGGMSAQNFNFARDKFAQYGEFSFSNLKISIRMIVSLDENFR